MSVNNVEPFHLDKILKLLRERNWDHINERMLGVMIFLLFKLNGISRKKKTETLNQIEGISYLTAQLYVSRLINDDIENIVDNNRGKYHRRNQFLNIFHI